MDVSKEEQRSVVRFLTEEGIRGTGVHQRMSQVYGEHYMLPLQRSNVAKALEGRTSFLSRWCTIWNNKTNYRWHRPAGWWTLYAEPPSCTESRSRRGWIELRKCLHHHDGKTELEQRVPHSFQPQQEAKWTTVLVICSAMPEKRMSSWHVRWL